ncbi:hypothetical protein MPSEU_000624900 [Mayamaea pseudoterrestris]|nr:hypothetical protein MPSEU_000624900 [Mayamaea pseudoterrestris]
MARRTKPLIVCLMFANYAVVAFVSRLHQVSTRPTRRRNINSLSTCRVRTPLFLHEPDATTKSASATDNLNHYMDLSNDDFHHLNPLWTELLSRFQGDFDNYNQVLHDRKQGKLPREGGGHEHIHCTMIPVTNNTRLAAFYFDGTPQAIFRFRFYQLVPASLVNGNDDDETIYTILYTLDTEVEGQLRAVSQEPLRWPAIFRAYNQSESATAARDADTNFSPSKSSSHLLKRLPDCEVEWSFRRDPILHAYASTEPPDAIHAVMVHGQALVDSQMIPGQRILIKDQLSLWSNALWIHDRGFEPDTMNFIYGNRDNVPYKMERVAEFSAVGETEHQEEDETRDAPLLSRNIVRDDLQWTLGPSFRTLEDYQAKINAMGGPSIPPRPAKP